MKIQEIYKNHNGNLSHKYESYLLAYEKHFSYRKNNVKNILEIGIQNGGSLEIWGKYFSKAENIIGVDINPLCASIKFDDPRIKVIIDSAISDSGFKKVLTASSNFDVIIDDGSHISSEIITTFYNYFPVLNPGGVYVVEDMHASYWESYGGGLHNQRSAHAFFKNITDTLNIDHLEKDDNIYSIFQTWINKSMLKDFLEKNEIYSITFQDSMIFIEKCSEEYKRGLGRTVICGSQATVDQTILKIHQEKT